MYLNSEKRQLVWMLHKKNEGLSKPTLRAQRLTPGSQCLRERIYVGIEHPEEKITRRYCVAAENEDSSDDVRALEIKEGTEARSRQHFCRRLHQNQPVVINRFHFHFITEVTVRRCQCSAEINITNICHKQAHQRFLIVFQVKWTNEGNLSLTREEGGRGSLSKCH